MKQIYVNCSNGADCESILSALYDLYDNKIEFLNEINNFKIGDIRISFNDRKINNNVFKCINKDKIDNVNKEKKSNDSSNEEDFSLDSLYAYEVGYDDYLKERATINNNVTNENNEKSDSEIMDFPLDGLYAYEVGYDDYLKERNKYQKKEQDVKHEQNNDFPVDSLCAFEIGYDDYLKEIIKNHEKEHEHNSILLNEINNIIDKTNLDFNIKEDIKNIFSILTLAMAKVQGIDVSEVHFHKDKIFYDITYVCGVAYLINKLNVKKVISSFISVSNMSNNADSSYYIANEILKGIPVHVKENTKNLTPLAAAIIKYYSDEFIKDLSIVYNNIGYGVGESEDILVEVFIGDYNNQLIPEDKVISLLVDLSDMNTNEIDFVFERLLQSGVLDVYTIPIHKKNGYSSLMEVILNPEDEESIVKEIFKYTKAFDIRRKEYDRYVLDKKVENIYTKYGMVRFNIAKGFGVNKVEPEIEDLKEIAKRENITLDEIDFK
ncbi:nickel insertion protein [Anaerofustis sp. NSJ-163]|uniref:nickel insertion protein n=1 Tax=Anaerofustis sp. NSJ-163 TaxID=2944391 RepID=UPI00209BE91F|nr:nickel insertion protein [Anaerofustis sp. NSJ-163]MCO8194454.1 LarC family nickel insertion protein [Anaerofustis sp. NSJ-163]